MAAKAKQPTTTDTTPATGEAVTIPTFTDLANNPKGITSRHIVAKLLDVHAYTVTLWVKRGQFPKPITIGNAHYFRNGELLDFLDSKTA